MANPHLTETGQPWWPSTYSSPIPAQPVATGTPNFGPPGTGGANQPPPTPIIDVKAEQDAADDAYAISLANQNNQTNQNVVPGPAGFTTGAGVPSEDEIKMARFKQAQADYANYGDDLNLWMEDPGSYEDAVNMGFFGSQAEGVLGGVTGYEKEVNLMKKAIESKVGKMNTQGLTDAQFKSGLTSLPEYQQLLKLYGGNQTAMQNTLFAPGTFDPNVDTGYDPTGINTWQDTESDPEKLAAYELLTSNDPNINPYSDEYLDALELLNYDWGPSFDQSWYGMDDFDYGFYGGMPPETASMTDPKYWAQDVVPTTPTSFADLQRIYGKEFGEERIAAPHAWGIDPFSETIIEGAY